MNIEKGLICRLRWPLQPHRPHALVRVIYRDDYYGEERWRLEDLESAARGWHDDMILHSASPSLLGPDSSLIQLAMQAE